MGKKIGLVIVLLLGAGALTGLVWLLRDANFAVLNPQGAVAEEQRNLIVFTVILSLLVVVPVFALTFMIAWRYRASNHKAHYRPNWQSNKLLESVWWGIPIVIIAVLAVITWQTSHSLDPYKPLDSKVKPVEVQVVALQWKWLFIYPEQNIASVNKLQFPEKTPINFTITADAPMNSFWIPSLGGQVYAMSGMSTKLHLIANETGSYDGRSANISGEGFSDMEFTANSLTREDFDAWVSATQRSSNALDMDSYNKLAQPAKLEQPTYYALKKDDLYDTIVMKYMMHEHDAASKETTEKTEHDMTAHEEHMMHMEGAQ